MRFQNGCNKVVIELRVVQFWSEIILVISNGTRAVRSSDFKLTRVISHQIALHSVQLPLSIRSRKRSIFVIDFYLNDSAFTEVKRDVKGVPFVNRRYTKGVPFS